MISTQNSAFIGLTSSQKDVLSKLDTNSDSLISRTEFVVGRPNAITEDQANQIFSELDNGNKGSLTLAASNYGASSTLSLSSEALEVLQGEQTQPTSDQIFAKLDSDSDGLVSRDEFVSGRPGFASEEQANALFDTIDTEGDGFVTQEGIEAVDAPSGHTQAAEAKPPPPPPPSATVEEYDELDTNEDGVVSITELLASYAEAAEEKAALTGESDDKGLLKAFTDASLAYTNYGSDDNFSQDIALA